MLEKQREKELILNLQQTGDFSAFAEIYKYYFPRVYNYIYKYFLNRELTEDAVSLAFEKALKNISSYNDQGYSFGAWLYKIAHNCALDSIQRSKKVTQIPFDYVLDSDTTEQKVTDQIEIDRLLEVIAKLPANYQEVIQLRYFEQYSIIETAEILNISVDSVKSIAKRAFNKLRKYIE